MDNNKCVLCGAGAVTTAAHIPVCQKHYSEYAHEANKYLPDNGRPVYRRLCSAWRKRGGEWVMTDRGEGPIFNADEIERLVVVIQDIYDVLVELLQPVMDAFIDAIKDLPDEFWEDPEDQQAIEEAD